MQGKLHLDSMYSIMSIFSEKYRLLICFKNYFVRKNSVNVTDKTIKECKPFQRIINQFQISPDTCNIRVKSQLCSCREKFFLIKLFFLSVVKKQWQICG